MCLVFCDALDPVHTLLLRVLSLNLVHQNSMNFVLHISSRLYDSTIAGLYPKGTDPFVCSQ